MVYKIIFVADHIYYDELENFRSFRAILFIYTIINLEPFIYTIIYL